LLDSAKQRLDVWEERLRNGLAADIDRRRRRVSETAARLLHPRHLIDRHNHRVTAETRALATAIGVVLRDRRSRLQHAASLLVSYSYQRVLERGFALVRDRSGHAVTTVAALHPGMGLLLRLHDGERKISVDNGNSGSARSGRGGSRLPTDQGTLL
jgi:exodeoxyribonuclease VII large subunit